MEAKDTVLKCEDNCPDAGTLCCNDCDYGAGYEDAAEAQAEISFKAGYKYALEGAVMEGGFESVKKLGIKEVVEWIESNNLFSFSYRSSYIWQAKLKEWGITGGK